MADFLTIGKVVKKLLRLSILTLSVSKVRYCRRGPLLPALLSSVFPESNSTSFCMQKAASYRQLLKRRAFDRQDKNPEAETSRPTSVGRISDAQAAPEAVLLAKFHLSLMVQTQVLGATHAMHGTCR